MEPPELIDTLAAVLKARGWQGRLVPAARVAEVRASFEDAERAGAFDSDFYDTELADRFHWDPPAGLDAASVLVVARPATAVRLTVGVAGRRIPVILPPTYRRYRASGKAVVEQADQVLRSAGRRAVDADVPKKTLAVRSGLAHYGRNNIAYFPGMGSYALITTVWTDLPVETDTWSEPVALPECESCRACASACPTGAIPADRFLLRGELCLPHLNEWPGEFPEWVSLEAHNALVGCMRCQDACPVDRPYRGWIDEGPEFDEDETRLLLAGAERADLSEATVGKLDSLETFLEHEIICRNLAAVLRNAG